MGDRTLTDADIAAIVAGVKSSVPACPNGLTAEATAELKALAQWLARARNIIGQTIIYGFVAAIVGMAMLGIGRFGGGK